MILIEGTLDGQFDFRLLLANSILSVVSEYASDVETISTILGPFVDVYAKGRGAFLATVIRAHDTSGLTERIIGIEVFSLAVRLFDVFVIDELPSAQENFVIVFPLACLGR